MVFDTQGPYRLPRGRKGSRVALFLIWTVASPTRRASPRASAPSPVHRHGDSGQAVRRLGARLLRDRQAPSPKKPGRPSNKPLPNSGDRRCRAFPVVVISCLFSFSFRRQEKPLLAEPTGRVSTSGLSHHHGGRGGEASDGAGYPFSMVSVIGCATLAPSGSSTIT